MGRALKASTKYLCALMASLGMASIAASQQWCSARPRASWCAIKPIYETRQMALSIARSRLGTGDCSACLRGVPVFKVAGGTFKLLQQPRVAISSCAEMALALLSILGGMQPATHHGQQGSFLKVRWCCGIYLRIFQCGSGSPYQHWQLVPAVARGSITPGVLGGPWG